MLRLALFLVSLALPVSAQTDPARISLLPGWRQADGHHMAALRIDLDPGWKTYWRAPGAAGIPPDFDWSGSRNIAGVQVHWPTPKVFQQGAMRSIGYEDGVVIPLEVRAADPDRPIDLSLDLDLGICREICIPHNARLAGSLSPEPAAVDPQIRIALANRPLSAIEARAGAMTCRVEPISDGVRLSTRLHLPPLGGDEMTAIEIADPTTWVSETVTTRAGDVLEATADLVPPRGAPVSLDRQRLRLTVVGTQGAVEITGCD